MIYIWRIIHYLPLTIHQQYLHRCLQLAKLGAGYTAPNPMVGAVLVYNGRIIGEGYHQRYGEAHAEVNCIALVKNENKHLISQSVLYVSLEPCSHFGKTPPCADLIIKNKIPKVIIGCRDPFKEVDGKGVEKLKAAGIEVEIGILEKECKELNKRFFAFHTQHRPYVILKWAQTADGKIASLNLHGEGTFEDSANGKVIPDRLLISNEYSNRLVHKWRSEETAILIGTNTALLDDPELTTRLWPGPSPVRLVVDMDLKLPSSLKIFNRQKRTIIFNSKVHSEESEWPDFPSLPENGEMKPLYWQITTDTSLVHQILNALYQLKIQSVLIEGGARLLQSFIDEGVWDEARIITNCDLRISTGLASPQLPGSIKIDEYNLFSDRIEIYKPAS
jgi:diaminohydroxyphosphoribosylaminopyrimidine deaminase / 5-amino-6-(5-phosphoribosylamino)uracil reductase